MNIQPRIIPEAVAAALAPEFQRAKNGESVALLLGETVYTLSAVPQYTITCQSEEASPELLEKLKRAEAALAAGEGVTLHSHQEIDQFMESMRQA